MIFPVLVLALVGHVISVEEIDTRHLSPVSNLSTGEITGSSWSGSRYERIELQIEDTVYIIRGREALSVGTDVEVEMEKRRIKVQGTDKKGRAKVWKYEIVGQKEKGR